jgi:hypothetical protein
MSQAAIANANANGTRHSRISHLQMGRPSALGAGVKKFIVEIFSASDLQDTQVFGSQDPYVSASSYPSRSRVANTAVCSSGGVSPSWSGRGSGSGRGSSGSGGGLLLTGSLIGSADGNNNSSRSSIIDTVADTTSSWFSSYSSAAAEKEKEKEKEKETDKDTDTGVDSGGSQLFVTVKPGDTHLLLEVWNDNLMSDDLIGNWSCVIFNTGY